MSVVEISGVSKRFGATTALEGIELEIGGARVRLADRAFRLWQVDAPADHW